MVVHSSHKNKFWENKAVLLSYYQEGIGGYQKIIYGSPQSVFAEIESIFPTVAQNLINGHADMIVQDGLLTEYFEEYRGLDESGCKDMDCNDVIKFLRKDMEEFRNVLKLSKSNLSIVMQKWYVVTHIFDTLPDGDHLRIEYENIIPSFCKSLYKSELDLINIPQATEYHFSQLGRLTFLASRKRSDWLKGDTVKLFQDFVIQFNEDGSKEIG